MTNKEIHEIVRCEINHFWTRPFNLNDVYDAGSEIFWSLNSSMVLDAPDLRLMIVGQIVTALPPGFRSDFRLHLLDGFEQAAHDEFGL